MSYNVAEFLERLYRSPAEGGQGSVTAAAEVETLPMSPTDLPADWHFFWDERAAIMEFDGGLPREQAEAAALAATIAEMKAAQEESEGTRA
ncbi:MAG: hypothetical protein JW741_25400 [Sedimentisphaerales bacterium]|nr:hypothetical protein [Sedimentisphaerales bacterium]